MLVRRDEGSRVSVDELTFISDRAACHSPSPERVKSCTTTPISHITYPYKRTDSAVGNHSQIGKWNSSITLQSWKLNKNYKVVFFCRCIKTLVVKQEHSNALLAKKFFGQKIPLSRRVVVFQDYSTTALKITVFFNYKRICANYLFLFYLNN